MSSMAPDWRVIGGPAATETGAAAPEATRPVVSTRQLAWASAAVVALLVLGAMGALLVMPGPGGVLVDAGGAADSWTTRSAAVTDPAASGDTGDALVSAPRPMVVDVEGAVVRPGLVSVIPGGRVGDAIELAGGFALNVDLEATASVLNLAEVVTDGLKVVVPAIGDAIPGGGDTGSSADGSGGPIDLNRATEAQLDGLPGVGPATIAKIVGAREESPFATVDELRSRGILGEAAFGKLRDLVTVGR